MPSKKELSIFGLSYEINSGFLAVRVNKEHVLELKPELPTTSFVCLFLLTQSALLDLHDKI